ncbi:MAG TPA: hypothetical protein DEB06_11440 [Phycisphaerales bacterium]|nr:hypothetical protein [Phycisphaerales bacterium]
MKLTYLIAGMIGGLLGASLWAAVTYFTNWEVGILAWLIGVLAGVGVRYAAKDALDDASGWTATAAALICVLLGKAAVVALILRVLTSSAGASIPEEVVVSYIADVVVRERLRAGVPVKWPEGVNPSEAAEQSDYPVDVWNEARSRWNQLPLIQQDRARSHPYLVDPEFVMNDLADEIVSELEAAGKTVTLTDEVRNAEPASGPERYPPEVWTEAESRWAAMTPPARQAREDLAIKLVQSGIAQYRQQVFMSAFTASFSFWDVLWFGLAGLSAWRIGSGRSGIADS